MRIELKKIMCAIDFSDFTNIILTYGKSMASEFGSTLCLCHIVSETMMVTSLGHSYYAYDDAESDHIQHAQDRLEKMAKEFDIDCEIIVSCGHAADEINETAKLIHVLKQSLRQPIQAELVTEKSLFHPLSK